MDGQTQSNQLGLDVHSGGFRPPRRDDNLVAGVPPFLESFPGPDQRNKRLVPLAMLDERPVEVYEDRMRRKLASPSLVGRLGQCLISLAQWVTRNAQSSSVAHVGNGLGSCHFRSSQRMQ